VRGAVWQAACVQQQVAAKAHASRTLAGRQKVREVWGQTRASEPIAVDAGMLGSARKIGIELAEAVRLA